MKNKLSLFITTMALALACGPGVFAQSKQLVTYQGVLQDGGAPANGLYDFTIRLYDAPTEGRPLGNAVTLAKVPVTDGLFTVELDVDELGFPNPDFTDPWFEYCIRHLDDPICWVISPRQRMTATPKAILADEARTVADGAITMDKLAPGAIGAASLQDAAVGGEKIADRSVVRSLNGIRDDVSLAVEDGLLMKTIGNQILLAPAPVDCRTYTNCYWNLLGNGNITASVNFLGTIAGELDPLEMRVNNNRCMLYRFTTAADAANLMGGHVANNVAVGFVGGTIGGGGSVGGPNLISANYGTVAGGVFNQIGYQAHFSAIGGGATNHIQSFSTNSTIAGGRQNSIGPNSVSATVGGGATNNVMPQSHYATISGGAQNTVQTNVTHATISGGHRNLIESSAHRGTIGGGFLNRIQATSVASTIGGGTTNIIQTSASHSTIAGGIGNSIQGSSPNGSIGGGSGNMIQPQTPNSTIAGGIGNSIQINALSSTIGGGAGNSIQNNAYFSTISGGNANSIHPDANYGTIGGGSGNAIRFLARNCVIDGGSGNIISTNSTACAVGGGIGNAIDHNLSAGTVGGGSGNRIQHVANSATVGGGSDNLIFSTAPFATIPGGYRAAATNYGQIAYASGYFAAAGDAQTCVYVVRTNTTSAGTNELFLDGVSQRIKVRPNSTWTFDVLVTARSSTGLSAGYKLRGVIENSAGVTALIGGFDTEMTKEEAGAAAWNAWVEADNVNDALVVKVVGAAANSIRWVASVRTAEAKW